MDVDQLRAWIELSVGSGMMARRLLIDAAKEIADIDPDQALEMLAAAAEAAWIAGDAQAGAELGQVAARLPPADTPRARFLTHLVNGFVGLLNGGVARPVRALRDAMDLAGEPDPDLVVRAGHVAFYLVTTMRRTGSTLRRWPRRATGAIGELLFALPRLALAEMLTGRWSAAEASADEAERLARETSQPGLRAVSLAWLAVLAVLTGTRIGSVAADEDRTAGRHSRPRRLRRAGPRRAALGPRVA